MYVKKYIYKKKKEVTAAKHRLRLQKLRLNRKGRSLG